LTNISKRK